MDIDKQFTGANFKSIFRILKGEGNTLYIGTWGEGLKRFKSDSLSFSVNPVTEHKNASLINCLFEDKYRNVWVGTYVGGIYKFNPARNGIQHFPTMESFQLLPFT
jgi:streptogramin lyase